MSRRGACHPGGGEAVLAQGLTETVLRIAVADDSREAVERFVRELMPLITAGPPGTTGYAEGRPRVHPLFRFWPCLIRRDSVEPRVVLLGAEREELRGDENGTVAVSRTETAPVFAAETTLTPSTSLATKMVRSPSTGRSRRLGDIAYARSGDKGIHANVGVIARRPEDFARLCREVTAPRVASHFGIADADRVKRYELPNLEALNFVIRGILANPLRVDAQGKALAQVLLELPLE